MGTTKRQQLCLCLVIMYLIQMTNFMSKKL